MSEKDESSSEDGVRSRGNVLALLGGAVAGAVAGALGRPERAVAGHDGTDELHLGQVNTADGPTNLAVDTVGYALDIKNDNDTDFAGAIQAFGSGSGDNFKATVQVLNDASGGIAVSGSSSGPGFSGSGDGIGVHGESGSGIGVEGSVGSGTGVSGNSETGVGTSGSSPSGAGVAGFSDTGRGVAGNSKHDIAVFGLSEFDGIGGHFQNPNPNGVGIQVVGRARFSTAGGGTVPQGQNSVFVSNPAVSADSHISVTLVGNPGNRELRWVQRSPGSGFTVNLTLAPPNQRPATAFTFLIVEAA